jgi:hypothetical protein
MQMSVPARLHARPLRKLLPLYCPETGDGATSGPFWTVCLTGQSYHGHTASSHAMGYFDLNQFETLRKSGASLIKSCGSSAALCVLRGIRPLLLT